VFESLTGDRLSNLGATNVIAANDGLLIGPSRLDPIEHARARQAWWRSSEKWDPLDSAEVRCEPPVVLWVAASLGEKVSSWRVCSWLRSRGIAASDVTVVALDPVPPRRTPVEPPPPFNCTASVCHHPDDVLLERFAEARPLSEARYEQAAVLWASYTAPDLAPFVAECSRGVPGFPELAPLWMFLSALFPRKTADGALRLSRFDQLLLTLLSGDWRTPVNVFAHDSPEGVELRRLACCTGDMFVAARLAQWAQHGETPAVERTPGPKPETAMLAACYRITEQGIRLRETGQDNLTDAPPLPLAGTEVYRSSAPWVLLDDGQLERL
jgi:hypothetical protein